MIKLVLRLIFLIVMAWVTGFAIYVTWINTLTPYDGKAQAAVVLTGGEGRVQAGLQLLEEGRVQRLLVSGVHPDVKVRELLAMNDINSALSSYVDLGFSAQDTLGNADETVAWVEKNEIESLIVVTSHYHMPRALVHLGEQLPNVALYSYPILPAIFKPKDWWRNHNARRLIINDYNKFLLTYPQILLLRYKNS